MTMQLQQLLHYCNRQHQFSILFTKPLSALPISAVYYLIYFLMSLCFMPKLHDLFVQEKLLVGIKMQLSPSL